MPPDDDADDRKVKDLIDAATERELERWFGLPSFTQLDEQGPPPPSAGAELDPEIRARAKQQERALAAVDPGLLAAISARTDQSPEDVFVTSYDRISLRVDPDFGGIDQAMLARVGSVAEPREVEIPEALIDDLKECTPQALLRDLHRAEQDFEKVFEIVDPIAEQRLDASSEVRDAMRTRWSLPELGESPVVEGARLLTELRAERRRPWVDVLPHLDRRTVPE